MRFSAWSRWWREWPRADQHGPVKSLPQLLGLLHLRDHPGVPLLEGVPDHLLGDRPDLGAHDVGERAHAADRKRSASITSKASARTKDSF